MLSGGRQLFFFFFLVEPAELWAGHKGVFVLEPEPDGLREPRQGPAVLLAPRPRNAAAVCRGDGWAHCPNRSLLANWEHIAVSVRHSITAWIAPLVLRLSECEREREREKYSFQPSAMSKKPLVTVWEHCLNAGVQKGKEVKKKGWDFYHLLLYF